MDDQGAFLKSSCDISTKSMSPRHSIIGLSLQFSKSIPIEQDYFISLEKMWMRPSLLQSAVANSTFVPTIDTNYESDQGFKIQHMQDDDPCSKAAKSKTKLNLIDEINLI